MEQSVPDAAAISADGIFTDDFWSDFYRDEGVVQSAAANQGVLQLPVYEQFVETINTLAILDYTEEVIISQPLATGSMKVNPYANYNPMPGLLALNPNNDFWTSTETQWTSSITRQFTAAPVNLRAVQRLRKKCGRRHGRQSSCGRSISTSR